MITTKEGEEGVDPIITAADRTMAEALLPMVEVGHLLIVAIVTEAAAAADGERACREYPSWSEMLARRSPPMTCKWPLDGLAMSETFTFHETTIRNNPKALHLSNMPIWIRQGKLVMKWIDSASKVVS